MKIVESKKEIIDFLEKWNNLPSLIVPIPIDLEKHPMNNELSFLYIRFDADIYILPFNHIDCLNIKIDLSKSIVPKFVWDKKSLLLYNVNIQNIFDIQSNIFFRTNKLLEFDFNELNLVQHYKRIGITDNVGKIIPILKWGEYLTEFTKNINVEKSINAEWIDNTMIPILSEIERVGVRVNTDLFKNKWNHSDKHLDGDIIYTYYNVYTSTSRPSNRWGGINFSALNKSDGSRNIFIPRPGKIFLQLDYDAYHPRIIGKMIDYKFTEKSVHQWLANQYGCSYSESKPITFKILYGGVGEEEKKIPFFAKVDNYIQLIGEQAEKDGYSETVLGRKIYLDWISNYNRQKLFNYLLQANETEYNIQILNELKLNKLPLPILYTYDSFLFETDGDISVIKRIKEIVEMFGFPVKATWGLNYGNL